MVLSDGGAKQAQEQTAAMYDVPDELTSRTEEDGAVTVPKTIEDKANEHPKTLDLYDNLPTV